MEFLGSTDFEGRFSVRKEIYFLLFQFSLLGGAKNMQLKGEFKHSKNYQGYRLLNFLNFMHFENILDLFYLKIAVAYLYVPPNRIFGTSFKQNYSTGHIFRRYIMIH